MPEVLEFYRETTSTQIHKHIDISPRHPELLEAHKAFRKTGRCSLLLMTDQGVDDPHHIVRLVDHKRRGFSHTEAHTDLVNKLASFPGHPKYDRDIFGIALHRLLLYNSTPFDNSSGIAPPDSFQDACFQLIFDYAPDAFCIIATHECDSKGNSVFLYYTKWSYVQKSKSSAWEKLMRSIVNHVT